MQYVAKNKNDVLFLKQVKRIFTSKTVLTSLFVTLFILILFDFLSKIPMPYLKTPDVSQLGSGTQTFLSMLNLLGGGGLKNLSIFATGISPYITTQIIIQLLSSDVIPPLARLTKSGEKGKKKISMITKIATLPFTIVQAYSIIAIYQSSGVSFNGPEGQEISGFYQFFYITLMCAGTYIAIFFSDILTKKGLGNGVTNLILAGIVSQLFGNFTLVKTSIDNHITNSLHQVIAFVFYMIFYFLILWTVTFISLSTRKIPIQQTGQSLIKEGDDLPYLPFKLNTAGVIPVIFASSLITLPLTIAEIVRSSYTNGGGEQNWFYIFANAVFNFNQIGGIINYMFLIILFTFFYSNIQLNPNRISTDFMKSGRFILGVKIGTTTEKYISKVLYRLNWIGGPFLAIVTALPYIVSYASGGIIPSVASLGGTGIIIMVSASIDLWDSIASASTTSSYTIRRRKIQSFDETNIYMENATQKDGGVSTANKDKDLLW